MKVSDPSIKRIRELDQRSCRMAGEWEPPCLTAAVNGYAERLIAFALPRYFDLIPVKRCNLLRPQTRKAVQRDDR